MKTSQFTSTTCPSSRFYGHVDRTRYTLGGLVFVAGIRRAEAHEHGMEHSIIRASIGEMRAVLMACLTAGLGLLPAALSHGIVQAQQPLARVVVGGMVTTAFAILIVVPVFATLGMVSTAGLLREPNHRRSGQTFSRRQGNPD